MQIYINSTSNTQTQSCYHIFKTFIIIQNFLCTTIIQEHTILYTLSDTNLLRKALNIYNTQVNMQHTNFH